MMPAILCTLCSMVSPISCMHRNVWPAVHRFTRMWLRFYVDCQNLSSMCATTLTFCSNNLFCHPIACCSMGRLVTYVGFNMMHPAADVLFSSLFSDEQG
jgi:hypothetical protein